MEALHNARLGAQRLCQLLAMQGSPYSVIAVSVLSVTAGSQTPMAPAVAQQVCLRLSLLEA
jgi:hypothetical protein